MAYFSTVATGLNWTVVNSGGVDARVFTVARAGISTSALGTWADWPMLSHPATTARPESGRISVDATLRWSSHQHQCALWLSRPHTVPDGTEKLTPGSAGLCGLMSSSGQQPRSQVSSPQKVLHARCDT